MLASRPFVGTGSISYGLYMWHYPIFAFGLMQQDNPTLVDKAGWS